MTRNVKDVLIIGSGAGGGPLALALAEAGLEVLVLEKGSRYTPEDYVHDELAARRLFVPALSEEPHVLVHPCEPQPRPTTLGWIACCVGGGTVHWGGYFYRFHPDDFRMRERFGPYQDLADWPYTYDELEPYYARAEREMGVAGLAGVDPFAGSRSQPYPLPPLVTHPLTGWLDDACQRRGLHAFPTPRAINSRPYQGRAACRYCDFCAGYGCPIGAKGSSQDALLPRAEATGRCEVIARAMVREITVGTAGRATGCVYVDAAGQEHAARARVVCVCCSAIESARLLLLSRSPLFPDGLANNSGLVGRFLQFHAVSGGQARFRYDLHSELPLRDPHPFLDRSVMDYYFLPAGVGSLPKGGLLRFGLPTPSPIATALELAEEGGELVWGARLKKRLREAYREVRTLEFEVFHDYLPNPGTWMGLDPEVRDKWGLPVARIHLDPDSHHEIAGRWLVDRGLEIFAEMGADELRSGVMGATANYLVHGTCRAGIDPRTSVLDSTCRAHEVPNLYVVDGSFMPTAGGVAPSLTIVANSFRVADHIVARARGCELG